MFYMRHSTPWKENNNMLIQLVTLLYAILLPSSLSNLDSWWLFMTFSCRGQTWEMRDAHLTVAVFMLPSLCLINMRLCTNDRDTWPRRSRSQSYDSLPRPHSVLSAWILSVMLLHFLCKTQPRTRGLEHCVYSLYLCRQERDWVISVTIISFSNQRCFTFQIKSSLVHRGFKYLPEYIQDRHLCIKRGEGGSCLVAIHTNLALMLLQGRRQEQCSVGNYLKKEFYFFSYQSSSCHPN